MKLNYFNFKKFGNKYLLTNDFGFHVLVSQEELKNILDKKINLDSEIGQELLDKKMIYEDTDLSFSALVKHELRRVKSHVNIATALHIFVVTTACNVGCIYCQANKGTGHQPFYMNKNTAEKAVDIALQSPAHSLNFEFQGGEPLLNFDIIKHIVLYAEQKKGTHSITYNIVSNLTLLTDEIIGFLQEYSFGISTSIDGPDFIHDENRPYKCGGGTFKNVEEAISRLHAKGLRVGAIQTTTRAALPYAKEIVHTYKDLGFESIFVRPLTPLGRALRNWETIGYTPEEYVSFYIKVIEEILLINKSGFFFKEDHTSILFSRISGNFVNYMELRSPCGAGIGQLAYYPDGKIFTCDEGRMLHEMGDSAFQVGNVFENVYSDLVSNKVCKAVCASSILESLPSCCDCVYQPYCGTCPVVNYAMCSDIIEKAPNGYRCKIYSGMLDYLFNKIMINEESTLDILRAWSY